MAVATKVLADVSDEELVAIALSGLKPGKSTDNYRFALRDFAEYCHAGSIGAALHKLWSLPQGEANQLYEAYLSDRESTRRLSAATLGPRASMLKRATKNARLVGVTQVYLETSPRRPGPKRDIRAVREKDWPERIIALLEAPAKAFRGKSAASARMARARDLAIVRLLLDRALWPREVEHLDLADVDLEAPAVRVRGEESPLPINPATRDALARWIEARGDWPGPLFTRQDSQAKLRSRITAHTICLMVHARVRQAGLTSDFSATDLRNVAIARGFDRGLDAQAVNELIRSRDTGRARPRVSILRAIVYRKSWDPGVLLGGSTERPMVLGNPKKKLSPSAYSFIRALLDAGQRGLTKAELEEKSGYKLPHIVLDRLRGSDADWGKVVHLSGDQDNDQGRYRLEAP